MKGRWMEATKRRQVTSFRLRGATRHEISRINSQRIRRRACGGSVRRKVRELQRLVPGGRELSAEQLFLRTADYIFELRMQVHALKALSELYIP